jgi:hypothetical protein
MVGYSDCGIARHVPWSLAAPMEPMMKYWLILALLLAAPAAHAAGCVSGPYRTGCAGPNGAAVVRHPAAPYRGGTVYHGGSYHGGTVHCARGVYRAGCAGPNGAAVVRRPY